LPDKDKRREEQAMSSAATNPLWDEFIVWLNTPEHERGEVSTEEEWAAEHGIADRTLRRWKKDPKFVTRREAHRVGTNAASVTGADFDLENASVDEVDYLLVKARLVEAAKTGNPKAQDLYFRTYGRTFVEEEAASRTSDLANMELDDLVSRAVLAVGPDKVAAHLTLLGWTVSSPVSP
jgi:hypothetical protein